MAWTADSFPTYAIGAGYIMSGNAVKAIYEASFSVPFHPFEDTYLIGMVATNKLHLEVGNIEHMWFDAHVLDKWVKHDWSWNQKLVALHPVDTPFVMDKVCEIIAPCWEQVVYVKYFYVICFMAVTVALLPT